MGLGLFLDNDLYRFTELFFFYDFLENIYDFQIELDCDCWSALLGRH